MTSKTLTSWTLPSVICIKVGIEPRKSNKACNLIAAFFLRKGAHQKTLKHKSIVVYLDEKGLPNEE